MENKNFGFDVRIWFKENSPYLVTDEIRHNVTEIHYLYPNPIGRLCVALESDIHGTGGTIDIEHIKEFEAKLATEIAEKY